MVEGDSLGFVEEALSQREESEKQESNLEPAPSQEGTEPEAPAQSPPEEGAEDAPDAEAASHDDHAEDSDSLGEDGDESDSSSEELVSSTPAVDEEGGAEEHAADLDEQTDPDEGPEVLDAVEGDKEDASLFLDPDDDDGEVFEVVDGQPEIVKEGEGGSDEESVDTSGHVAELEEKLTAQEERLNHVEEQMGELEKERDDLKQRLIRNAADMENFRKRKERERKEIEKYGANGLVRDLLPAVDNLERALEHAEKSQEESSIADGVRMVHRQLLSSLEKHGVKGFNSVGERFDPQRHEAIQQVETTEHDTGTIVQEAQKGYFLHDRLLRPSLAIVAKRVEPPAEEEPADEEEAATSEDTAAAEEAAATQEPSVHPEEQGQEDDETADAEGAEEQEHEDTPREDGEAQPS